MRSDKHNLFYLPHDPTHRLVEVIAANSGLTVDEVRAEQLERTAAIR